MVGEGCGRKHYDRNIGSSIQLDEGKGGCDIWSFDCDEDRSHGLFLVYITLNKRLPFRSWALHYFEQVRPLQVVGFWVLTFCTDMVRCRRFGRPPWRWRQPDPPKRWYNYVRTNKGSQLLKVTCLKFSFEYFPLFLKLLVGMYGAGERLWKRNLDLRMLPQSVTHCCTDWPLGVTVWSLQYTLQ